jgi:N-acetyl-anhydromuramyl-L-alanine amidase AmpD
MSPLLPPKRRPALPAALRLGLPLVLLAACDAKIDADEGPAPELEANVDSEHETASNLDEEFAMAAEEWDVPVGLLQAIAWENTRWQMVEGHEEFEGQPPLHGIMGIPADRIEIAAAVLETDWYMVQYDRQTNIRAGAALLAAAAPGGFDRADLSRWAEPVAAYSAIEALEGQSHYVHEGVYRVLREGVSNELGLLPPVDVAADFPQPSSPRRSADRSGVVWRPSPNSSSRPSGASGTPSMVIIHTCEGSYSGCWSWLTNSRSGVSAHYVVNSDGTEVSQLVTESRKAWHIGATYDCDLNSGQQCARDGQSSNNFTVGIEHAGYASQGSWSAGLVERSAQLVCDITDDWGIPQDRYHIVGHGQLQPYNRVDPGPNWPWTSYLSRIAALCGASGGSGSGGSGSGSGSGGSGSGSGTDSGSGTGAGTDSGSGSGGSGSGAAIDIVIDSNSGANGPNAEIEVSSYWGSSNNVAGYYNTGYWWRSTAESSDPASFWFYLDAPARLQVQAWWPAASDRSRSAPFIAFDGSDRELGRAYVDQSRNGSRWNTLGTWDFPAGWNRVALSRWTTTGYVVVADAVRVSTAP